jgi:5-(carboxyamino)imidazole ribonucleotide mutase
MVASHTLVPVIGVPVRSRALQGLDSLLSIVQMPAGVPVATMAIGPAGATNAALFAVALLATTRPPLQAALAAFRASRAEEVRTARLPWPETRADTTPTEGPDERPGDTRDRP